VLPLIKIINKQIYEELYADVKNLGKPSVKTSKIRQKKVLSKGKDYIALNVKSNLASS